MYKKMYLRFTPSAFGDSDLFCCHPQLVNEAILTSALLYDMDQKQIHSRQKYDDTSELVVIISFLYSHALRNLLNTNNLKKNNIALFYS